MAIEFLSHREDIDYLLGEIRKKNLDCIIIEDTRAEDDTDEIFVVEFSETKDSDYRKHQTIIRISNQSRIKKFERYILNFLFKKHIEHILNNIKERYYLICSFSDLDFYIGFHIDTLNEASRNREIKSIKIKLNLNMDMNIYIGFSNSLYYANGDKHIPIHMEYHQLMEQYYNRLKFALQIIPSVALSEFRNIYIENDGYRPIPHGVYCTTQT